MTAPDTCYIKVMKTMIDKVINDPKEAKKALNVCCIYISNMQSNHFLYIKLSRFNHACQPNATTIIHHSSSMNAAQIQVRAIEDIKQGQEINQNYLDGSDPFCGFRNGKHRKKALLEAGPFLCLCDLCESKNDIDATG